jgi:membrane associated rhomboid family serine protease
MTQDSAPWRTSRGLYPKPEDAGEYGYVDQKGAHTCTREELIEYFQSGRYKGNVPAWWPEHSDVLPPAEIPFLRDAYGAGLRRRALRPRPNGIAVFFALAGGLILLLGPDLSQRHPVDNWRARGIGLIGIALVAEVLPRFLLWRRSRAMSDAKVAADALDTRYNIWVEDQAPDFSFWIWIGLAVMGVLQVFAVRFEPIELAGLKPSAVRAGEWWRLLSAALLHGGVLHFYMNWMAFESFATRIELATHRVYVPLVFLVSTIYGNLASVVLRGDDRISVGASGGILGLVGFLLIIARRQRAHLPPGFTRMTAEVIALTALIGIIGYELIDNAAHAGGLMAGLILGLALVPERLAGADNPQPSLTVRVLGYVALAGLVFSALLTVGVMYGFEIG